MQRTKTRPETVDQADPSSRPSASPVEGDGRKLPPELFTFAVYLVAVVVAELTVLMQRPDLALGLDAVLVFILMIRSQLTKGKISDLHVALIVPLSVRLFVLAFPLDLLPAEAHLPLAGSVLLVTTLLAARLLGYTLGSELGLNLRYPDYVPLIALFGVPLGFIAFDVLRPEAVTYSANADVVWHSLGLLAFTGFAEELLFRGLLLTAAVRALGPTVGMTLAAGVYAANHLTSGSLALVVLGTVIGIGTCWIVVRLRSITGVILGHGIMNILLLVVLPLLDA